MGMTYTQEITQSGPKNYRTRRYLIEVDGYRVEADVLEGFFRSVVNFSVEYVQDGEREHLHAWQNEASVFEDACTLVTEWAIDFERSAKVWGEIQ